LALENTLLIEISTILYSKLMSQFLPISFKGFRKWFWMVFQGGSKSAWIVDNVFYPGRFFWTWI